MSPRTRLLFCLTFASLLCLNFSGVAPGEETSSLPPAEQKAAPMQKVIPMGIRQVVARTLVANLDIAVDQYNPDISDAQLLSAKGAFDPLITFNYSYSDQKIPQTSQEGLATGAAETEAKTNDLNLTLAGKLPSGTQYTFFFDRERSQFIRRGVFDPLTSSFITQTDPWQYVLNTYVNLTQPMLKNFGFEANLAPIRIARAQRDISIENFKEQVITILSQSMNAYWTLVLTIENLKVSEYSLKLAQDLLRENRIRLEVGTMSPLDVLEAETGVAQAEQALILSRAAVEAAEDNLKQVLNLPRSIEDWSIQIVPTDKPETIERQVDLPTEVQLAMENRPDYKAALMQIESNTINERFAKNQLLPSLDINGQYQFQAVDFKVHNAVEDIEKGTSPSWMAGLTAQYPIGNRTAKGNYETAKLQTDQSEKASENLRLSIIVGVRKAVRDIETSLESISATHKTTEFAQKSLEAEQKKHEVGIATSHEVLQFIDDLTTAQRGEVVARVAYRTSLINLSASTGTLLKENDIVIDESL